jgi:hypothetical protein
MKLNALQIAKISSLQIMDEDNVNSTDDEECGSINQ